jgi:quercetin dioxygenase-like cupin family protein
MSQCRDDSTREHFSRFADCEVFSKSEGVNGRVLIVGQEMMAVHFELEPNSGTRVHSHPHEQIGHVLSGSVEIVIANQCQVLTSGDSYCIPSGTLHAVLARERASILDVYCPPRLDYLLEAPGD